MFWPALILFAGGIAGLFFLDRDKTARTSAAFWIPLLWIWIAGSRPVTSWWSATPTAGVPAGGLDSTLDGNPVDAAIYALLLLLGVAILFARGKKTTKLLKAGWPVTLFFTYCLLSAMWSPFPETAFKRWTKAVGDVVMVLILVTEIEPMVALRSLFSTISFILMPLSVFLIRYTDIGRTYDAAFQPANVGVTTNKNTLGLIVFILSLGILWNFRNLYNNRKIPNRGRRLLAQGVTFAFGAYLLQQAHSATSVLCLILGGGLMFATGLSAIKKRPGRVLALCLVVVLAGGATILFGGQSDLSTALGRGSGLSGRTDIWAASIASAGNPIIGSGFESFWNANSKKVGDNLILRGFSKDVVLDLVSAHNGYLEVYLDLGLVGLGLIVLILLSGYRSASKAFQRDPGFSGLMLAYIVTSTFYSVTEAGFRMLTPSWIFLVLAVVSTSGMAAGLVQESSQPAGLAPASPQPPVRPFPKPQQANRILAGGRASGPLPGLGPKY
jgi:exopolysaccharide production protein ExoQ